MFFFYLFLKSQFVIKGKLCFDICGIWINKLPIEFNRKMFSICSNFKSFTEPISLKNKINNNISWQFWTLCINLLGNKKGPEQHGKWQSKFVPRLVCDFCQLQLLQGVSSCVWILNKTVKGVTFRHSLLVLQGRRNQGA